MSKRKIKWKWILPILGVLLLTAIVLFVNRTPETDAPSASFAELSEIQPPAEQETADEETKSESPVPIEEKTAPTAASEDTAQETAENAPAPEPSAQPSSPKQETAPEKTQAVSPAVNPSGTKSEGKEQKEGGNENPDNPDDTNETQTCTLSISCATILDHLDICAPEKRSLVPEDGWILEPTTVSFSEGESVFTILERTCKENRIHLEFTNAPLYDSAYIEGIGNLYEFDVGELSGWMYKVNEAFPNYGCSSCSLKAGDTVCWVYTCDLGSDVGKPVGG